MVLEESGSGGEQALRVSAWRRFFARVFDLCIALIFPLIALKLLPGSGKTLIAGYGPLNPLWIVAGILCVPLETSTVALWGTTPGKRLLGLSVRQVSGHRIRWKSALSRSFSVFTLGLACLLPVLCLLTMAYSYRRLSESGATDWDRRRFYVIGNHIRKTQVLLFSLLFMVLLVFTAWIQ